MQHVVSFSGPPQLDMMYTSSDKIQDEGTSDEMVCNATGRPDPLVQWTRLGNALLPTGSETYSVRYILEYCRFSQHDNSIMQITSIA